MKLTQNFDKAFSPRITKLYQTEGKRIAKGCQKDKSSNLSFSYPFTIRLLSVCYPFVIRSGFSPPGMPFDKVHIQLTGDIVLENDRFTNLVYVNFLDCVEILVTTGWPMETGYTY